MGNCVRVVGSAPFKSTSCHARWSSPERRLWTTSPRRRRSRLLRSDSPSSPGAADERELGLTPSDLEFLAVEAARIPFEPAMLAIARLAAATWQIPLDAARQLALADSFFDGAPIVEQLRRWVGAEPGRVVFSEQQFFVVQRLLVDFSRDVGHFELEQAAGVSDASFWPTSSRTAPTTRGRTCVEHVRARVFAVRRARARSRDGRLNLRSNQSL